MDVNKTLFDSQAYAVLSPSHFGGIGLRDVKPPPAASSRRRVDSNDYPGFEWADFGDRRRFWDFRSLGRGNIDFEEIIRALNRINYQGPLSVEWEDSGMDREHGATEAAAFVKEVDFAPSDIAFDAAFED